MNWVKLRNKCHLKDKHLTYKNEENLKVKEWIKTQMQTTLPGEKVILQRLMQRTGKEVAPEIIRDVHRVTWQISEEDRATVNSHQRRSGVIQRKQNSYEDRAVCLQSRVFTMTGILLSSLWKKQTKCQIIKFDQLIYMGHSYWQWGTYICFRWT